MSKRARTLARSLTATVVVALVLVGLFFALDALDNAPAERAPFASPDAPQVVPEPLDVQ